MNVWKQNKQFIVPMYRHLISYSVFSGSVFNTPTIDLFQYFYICNVNVKKYYPSSMADGYKLMMYAPFWCSLHIAINWLLINHVSFIDDSGGKNKKQGQNLPSHSQEDVFSKEEGTVWYHHLYTDPLFDTR